MWVYLNDRFLPGDQAHISVFDHGFLYGDGIYETLRAYQGKIFMVKKHIARLYRSANLIGLTIPLDEDAWPPLLHETLQRNGLGLHTQQDPPSLSPPAQDGYIRVTISRGKGDIGLDPSLCPVPTVLIIAKPLTPYPADLFERGIHLALVSVRRNSASALPPQIKSLNFLNNILAKHEATKMGAFDSLMLNAEGYLTECSASNFFFIHKGRLCTPSIDCGILDGITREVVLLLSKEQSIPIEEGTYRPDVISTADECFVTNTSMEIMPVTQMDHSPIGNGLPGPITCRLQRLFKEQLPRFLSNETPSG